MLSEADADVEAHGSEMYSEAEGDKDDEALDSEMFNESRRR